MPERSEAGAVDVFVYYRVEDLSRARVRSCVTRLFEAMAHATRNPPALSERICISGEAIARTWMECYPLISADWRPFILALERSSKELNLHSGIEGERHIEVFSRCA
jgi:hypothetical protein